MRTTITTYVRGVKTVTLFGMCHVGTEMYYQNTIREISDSCSDVVLFEGIKGMSFNLKEIYVALASSLGLVMQKDFVKKQSNFIVSDIDYPLLISVKGSEIDVIKKISECKDEFFEMTELIENNKILKFLALNALKYSGIITRFVGGSDNFAILQFRNNKVISDIFEHLKNNYSVSVVYGQGHIKGIESFLLSSGFKKTNKIKLNPFKK